MIAPMNRMIAPMNRMIAPMNRMIAPMNRMIAPMNRMMNFLNQNVLQAQQYTAVFMRRVVKETTLLGNHNPFRLGVRN
jgi:hypothetical protein